MSPVKKSDRLLYEELAKRGLLSEKILQSILEQAESTGGDFVQILIERNFLPETEILKVLAEKLKLAFVDLKAVIIDGSLINKVPMKVASHYRFIPLEIKDGILKIAVARPLDIKTQDDIRMHLGYDVELALSCADDIFDALKRYYGMGADTLQQLVTEEAKGLSPSAPPVEADETKIDNIEKLAETASVISLVNQLILEAWKKRATDIHLEPYRDRITLRYRIDGVLYDIPVPPEIKSYFKAIISRIKIMSNLNIVERRLPQDGRAVVRVQEQILDLRISTMPTPFGESVVIRILPSQMLFSLEKLGLSKKDAAIFKDLINRPHGIIFITGPTGSGKTTTLYTCLSEINTKDRKIITLEDPIEYEIEGVTQIQVMPEINLDFARGLRSILRHDPDVIMVGEVRDLETAEIAIRVALTGHLVFSTLHTNDAASGVTRLVDIGVEPYLVTSSVQAFIAQRLIRIICSACRYEDKEVSREIKDLIAADLGLKSAADVRIFRGKGCPKCNSTGFYGRNAIYEVLLLDDAIKDLITKKAQAGDIKKMAVSRGMRTLRQDGWSRVISGQTTPEEVIEATPAENSQPLPKADSANRRTYKRLNERVDIKYKLFEPGEKLTKTGLTPDALGLSENISAGGALFVTKEPFSVGAFLELKIPLPDGEKPIETLAKVVRASDREKGGYDTAVCFLDMSSAERARLDKYVRDELKE